MGNCLELLLQSDRPSGTSRWWWSSPAPPPSQWSNLSPEVATNVLHHLLAGGADHVRFAAVCPQWRAMAQQASLPAPLPLLILPDGTAYSLVDGKPFPFPRCAGYAGICGDWLVFSRDAEDGDAQLVLVDPFSDTTMTLPALSRVRFRHASDDEPSFASMEMIVRKVICCSPPHLIAALVRLGDHCTGIAVCQAGAASWWSVYLDERFSGFDDYTFHNGILYAVDYPGGDLFSIDIGVDDSTGDPWVSQIQQVIGSTTTDGTTFRGDDYLGEMLYLVEFCAGELLMVRRIINGQWVQLQNGAVHDAAIRRNEFQVFKADFEWSRWTEARTIGDDQVLFLRQRCSKSGFVFLSVR
ncbi:hypothetical protein PR202_gb13560 [Eleusine coracana subsp. coracana]|uniref:KIB1-4 beta-propeller domain-containing protein n=1 Tax=Eleusine coracana subsp. coracana TaxID=191504 RepID=A0AAV5ESC5_ELECO|nr:hypothetical protein PR202_gb13560 [Eleusine coracana subsp. coracana]